jgi:hypothetical protein
MADWASENWRQHKLEAQGRELYQILQDKFLICEYGTSMFTKSMMMDLAFGITNGDIGTFLCHLKDNIKQREERFETMMKYMSKSQSDNETKESSTSKRRRKGNR